MTMLRFLTIFQRNILAEVERRMEAAREVESALEEGMKLTVKLRQAVLRAAFEGRLSMDFSTPNERGQAD